MEKNKLQEMIEVFKKSGLAKMEYSEDNAGKSFSIYLEAPTAAVATSIATPTQVAVATLQEASIEQAKASSKEAKVETKCNYVVKSPMIGVFYAASSPTAAPFVTVGSKVKKGDVICIIEAMKLMNEIVAEQDGTIVEICAKNGDLIEFEQELFKIL